MGKGGEKAVFSPAFKIFKRFKGEGGKTLKDQFVVKGGNYQWGWQERQCIRQVYLWMGKIRITFPEFFAKSWEVL